MKRRQERKQKNANKPIKKLTQPQKEVKRIGTPHNVEEGLQYNFCDAIYDS